MTKYREILRLHSLKLSQRNIALSCSVSKTTVNRILKRAAELNLSWPLNDQQTGSVLSELLISIGMIKFKNSIYILLCHTFTTV